MPEHYELLPVEDERLDKFLKKHKKCLRNRTYTVSFTPTGIGYAVKVRCNACEKEKNITDYDSW